MLSSINHAALADTATTDACPAARAAAASPTTSAPQAGKPEVIASRRRCEADGVGLSHYILMDRKAGQ